MKKIFLSPILLGLVLCGGVIFSANSYSEPASNVKVVATFAGGCFWCMEGAFDALPGVAETVSGYTGGTKMDPTYEEVSLGKTGHYESVQVSFDPARTSYEKLLEVFWQNIDPFDNNGQFCDKGDQYRAAIFYQDENQKRLAEASKIAMQTKFKDKPLVTAILPARQFFPAEDYHQNYYQVNPVRYKFYRFSCGRDQRLRQLWDEPTAN